MWRIWSTKKQFVVQNKGIFIVSWWIKKQLVVFNMEFFIVFTDIVPIFRIWSFFSDLSPFYTQIFIYVFTVHAVISPILGIPILDG